MNLHGKLLAGASLGAMFASAAVSAPCVAAEAMASPSAELLTIDEVIVTAQKRPENVQDVPLAITVVSSEALAAKQIESAADLERIAPGLLSVPSDAPSAQLIVRGIGSVNTFAGGDPGVPIHLDGHYLQAPSFILHDMLDVSRVEVLRGPQGTLYGRNAIGGNVNIISNTPTENFEGRASVGVGNYQERNLALVLSGPISSAVTGRIAISRGGHEGYISNISPKALKSRLGNDDYINGRATLKFQLANNIDATVSSFYYKNNASGYAYRTLGDPVKVGGATFVRLPKDYINPTNKNPLEVRQDGPNIGSDLAKGISLDLNWSLGDLSFKSLSQVTQADNYYQVDLDATDASPLVEFGITSKYDTISQELQSNYASQKLNIVGGLYYYHEKSKFYRYFEADPRLYGVEYGYYYDPVPTLTNNSYGIYLNGDYLISPKWKLTAGARYSHDEKSMYRGYQVRINGRVTQQIITDQNQDWGKLTWRVALGYEVTDDLNAFASISTGYKSGGYNALGTTQLAYNPETAVNYEFGLKGEYFDRRLRVNAAIFQADYQDKQELVKLLGAGALGEVAISNSGGATTRGVEVEATAILGKYLALDVNATHLDATYDSLFSVDPVRTVLGLIDLKGKRVPFSPEWKFGVAATAKLPVSDERGSVSGTVSYAWTDSAYSAFYNRRGTTADLGWTDYVPARSTLDVSANWKSPQGTWTSVVFVKNLQNNIDLIQTQPSYHRLQQVVYTKPRTFGLKVSRIF
jgi:iron complex outermembrane receptor protein